MGGMSPFLAFLWFMVKSLVPSRFYGSFPNSIFLSWECYKSLLHWALLVAICCWVPLLSLEYLCNLCPSQFSQVHHYFNRWHFIPLMPHLWCHLVNITAEPTHLPHTSAVCFKQKHAFHIAPNHGASGTFSGFDPTIASFDAWKSWK